MNTSTKTSVTLLGTGDMGTALGRAWLAAGHPVTVWNRTAKRTRALADAGAYVASTVAEALSYNNLVVLCLLDDASINDTLSDVDLADKDLVNLTTSTPDEARARAEWASIRGARFLDGGVMAVPPMIGVPESGGFAFYSGSRAMFEAHRETLAVPAGTTWRC